MEIKGGWGQSWAVKQQAIEMFYFFKKSEANMEAKCEDLRDLGSRYMAVHYIPLFFCVLELDHNKPIACIRPRVSFRLWLEP